MVKCRFDAHVNDWFVCEMDVCAIPMNGLLSFQLTQFYHVCGALQIHWLKPTETIAESDLQETDSDGACVDN